MRTNAPTAAALITPNAAAAAAAAAGAARDAVAAHDVHEAGDSVDAPLVAVVASAAGGTPVVQSHHHHHHHHYHQHRRQHQQPLGACVVSGGCDSGGATCGFSDDCDHCACNCQQRRQQQQRRRQRQQPMVMLNCRRRWPHRPPAAAAAAAAAYSPTVAAGSAAGSPAIIAILRWLLAAVATTTMTVAACASPAALSASVMAAVAASAAAAAAASPSASSAVASASAGAVARARAAAAGRDIREIVANPGEKVGIPCLLEMAGGSIQWVRNGRPVVLESATAPRRQWTVGSDGGATLQISQVTRADDGLWECWEFGDDGSVRRIAKVLKLVVTGAPEEPFLVQDGKRVHPGSNVVARENRSLTVDCVARRAVPEVRRVFWSLGPAGVNVTSLATLRVDYVAHEDSYTTKSTLTLNATRAMNGQRIVCHVFHVAWPNASSVGAALNVLYPPSFSISRVPPFGLPVLEKTFVSLQCIVDSNPPAAAYWSKDDHAVNSSELIRQGGGYLNFTSIDRDHSGWYRCTAKHPMGNYASFGYLLKVLFGPEMMDDTPKQMVAAFGESVRLECRAEGKPPPSYCWTRHQAGGGRIAEGLSGDSSLLLDPVVYEDAGTYQCTATSRLDMRRQRNAIREVQLAITGRPDVNALNTSMIGVLGHSLWITVHVCANPQPLRSHWLLGRYLLSPGDDRKAHPHYIAHPYQSADTPFCRYASLEIPSVRYADNGEFLFLARNERGIDDAVVNVTVVKAAYGGLRHRYHGGGSAASANAVGHHHRIGGSSTSPQSGSVRSEMSRPANAGPNAAASDSFSCVPLNSVGFVLQLAFAAILGRLFTGE